MRKVYAGHYIHTQEVPTSSGAKEVTFRIWRDEETGTWILTDSLTRDGAWYRTKREAVEAMDDMVACGFVLHSRFGWCAA